jgi:hypothetical protein
VVLQLRIPDDVARLIQRLRPSIKKKKSKAGIKTPQYEIDLIRERIKRLKEVLN